MQTHMTMAIVLLTGMGDILGGSRARVLEVES